MERAALREGIEGAEQVSADAEVVAGSVALHSDPTVGLVIEHVVPLGIHIEQLLVASGDELRIRSILNEIEFVVITKAEDDWITRAGWRTTVPAGGDRYQRYRDANLFPEEFVVPSAMPIQTNGEGLV